MSLMLKNAEEKTFIYYPWFILQQNTDVTVIQIQIKLESNELEKFISSSVGNVQCESVRRIQRPGRYYHVPHKSPAFPPGCLDITETQLLLGDWDKVSFAAFFMAPSTLEYALSTLVNFPSNLVYALSIIVYAHSTHSSLVP